MKASEIQMDETIPHGTREGYAAGCQGSHCPATEKVGMSCKQANMRFASDLSYRRRREAGMSPEAIWADDQLEAAQAPAKPAPTTKSDQYGNSFSTTPSVTVADSERDFVEEPAEPVEEANPRAKAAPAKVAIDDPAFPHGTNAGYQRGCRDADACPAHFSCMDAKRKYQREYAAKRAGRSVAADAVTAMVDDAFASVVAASPPADDAVEEMTLQIDANHAGEVPLPEAHEPAVFVPVREEGLLSDLADAKDMVAGLEEENERLARELALTIAANVDEQTRVRGLQKQHEDDVVRITKLQDELTQVSLRLDVQKSAEATEAAELARVLSIPPAPLMALPAASTPELALEVSQPSDGVTAIRFAADGASRRLDLSFHKGRLQHAAISTGE